MNWKRNKKFQNYFNGFDSEQFVPPVWNKKFQIRNKKFLLIYIYIESLIDKKFSYLSASLPDKRISRGLLFRKMKWKFISKSEFDFKIKIWYNKIKKESWILLWRMKSANIVWMTGDKRYKHSSTDV